MLSLEELIHSMQAHVDRANRAEERAERAEVALAALQAHHEAAKQSPSPLVPPPASSPSSPSTSPVVESKAGHLLPSKALSADLTETFTAFVSQDGLREIRRAVQYAYDHAFADWQEIPQTPFVISFRTLYTSLVMLLRQNDALHGLLDEAEDMIESLHADADRVSEDLHSLQAASDRLEESLSDVQSLSRDAKANNVYDEKVFREWKKNVNCHAKVKPVDD